MLELHINTLSYIGQGHEVMLELYINTPRYIGQGHKVIYIKVLVVFGRAIKFYQSYTSMLPTRLGIAMKLYQDYA